MMLFPSPSKSIFVKIIIAGVILALSLLLLIFIGLGDAYKNYTNFTNDKIYAQGQIIQNSIKTFLDAGLPLEQFSRFNGLTEPLLKEDSSIEQISIVNKPQEKLLFCNNKQIRGNEDYCKKIFSWSDSRFQPEDNHYQLRENQEFYQVVLSLKNKFGEVGELQIISAKSTIREKVLHYFLFIGIISFGFLVIFLIIAFLFYKNPFQKERKSKLLEIAYSTIYIVVASLVVFSLTFLYSEGIQAKTQAMTNSLSSRLDAALELGLDLADFEGIDKIFDNYIKLNPEIAYITLKSDDKNILTSPSNYSEKNIVLDQKHFEYEVDLSSANQKISLYAVLIRSPKNIIYSKIWRSVKNFLALFVASGFITVIFLNLLNSLTNKPNMETEEYQDFVLKQIEPLYFLGSFIDGLALSFLPQYLQNMAVESNVNPNFVSTQFTVFFLGWAIAMIPTTKWIQKKGIKPVLMWVSFLIVLMSILMAFVTNFYMMYVVRAMAGACQGFLVVAVQDYILQVTSEQKKTQGSAMMVFDFFGARLSSTAIGALLSVYVGIQGVFIIAIFISLVSLLYCCKFIPNSTPQVQLFSPEQNQQPDENLVPVQQDIQNIQKHRTFRHDLIDTFKDWQFFKTLTLIGLPYRAVFTGVTVFALPLLLKQQGYQPEDIGQILMFYAAGILISSTLISPIVDRIGRADFVLILGCITSGLGLFLVGLMSGNFWDQNYSAYLPTIIVLLGIIIVGIGHGFINAPSFTYITQTKVAKNIGENNVGALYRVSERAGQIAGPIIVGQLLLFNQNNAFTISWIGIAIICFGILFALQFNKKKVSEI
jgi:MFS family permease